MAIFRKKTRKAVEFERVMCGGSREPEPNERVADFSYQNESLAQMIAHAWTDQNFRTRILRRTRSGTSPNAKAEFAERGIFLKNPVVITEDEYNNGYQMKDRHGVVFVLPNQPRTVTPPPGETLLETARLLMACTPNGI
jgi:hypothetical protein